MIYKIRLSGNPIIVVATVLLLILSGSVSVAQQPAVTLVNQPDVAGSDEQADPYRSEFFRVDHSPNLTVNTLSGDIEVTRDSGIDGVQVDLYIKRDFSLWSGSRSLDNYRIIIQKQGNSIIASVEDRRTGRTLRAGDTIHFSFRIKVPRKASLNLRTIRGEILADGVEGQHYLQNHDGNIDVNRMEGEIRAVSTVGNIHLRNLNGNIFAKTVSGNILGENNFGEVRLRTTTGDINTSGTSGTLVAASTSGHIRSDLNVVSMGVYLETTTGDIDLTLPVNDGYDIDAKGLSFDFDGLRETGVIKKVGFRHATVEIREGGIPVNLKSVAGSINVREIQ